MVYQEQLIESVNCIEWAPWEFGLILAAGTAEGKIQIITKEKEWHTFGFLAHKEAVNGVSWAAFDPSDKSQTKRLVSCSSDKQVKLWELKDESKPTSQAIGQHDDWVRDVAWCDGMIASCGEDRVCNVWKHEAKKGWSATKIEFSVPLWKVSWSSSGQMLAVSGGDNEVHVMSADHSTGEWKETNLE